MSGKSKKSQKTFIYATLEGKRQRIDYFAPSELVQKPLPVVFLIHGGGWTSGSRKDEARLGRKLAGKGYAAFSVDYRLAPLHRSTQDNLFKHTFIALISRQISCPATFMFKHTFISLKSRQISCPATRLFYCLSVDAE